jgi:3-oxoacyl-[acyl-carrier protein] reductase
MDISLKGRNAVIGGSTQGIGLAVAKELALNGATCILLARNETGLKEAITMLPIPFNQQHEYRVADFSKNHEVKEAIDSIVARMNVHILINNTGGPKPGPIADAGTEQFEAAFQQHIVNNQILTQAVLPGMNTDRYGRIINITSTSVRVPIDNLGVSNTIRAAVASWAKTLSNEIGTNNITVNTILPGLTETKRLDMLIENTAQKKETDTQAVIVQMLNTIPIKRFGQAEELANVVAFLASAAASYINGVTIPVDGGRTGTI